METVNYFKQDITYVLNIFKLFLTKIDGIVRDTNLDSNSNNSVSAFKKEYFIYFQKLHAQDPSFSIFSNLTTINTSISQLKNSQLKELDKSSQALGLDDPNLTVKKLRLINSDGNELLQHNKTMKKALDNCVN